MVVGVVSFFVVFYRLAASNFKMSNVNISDFQIFIGNGHFCLIFCVCTFSLNVHFSPDQAENRTQNHKNDNQILNPQGHCR